MTPPKPPPRPTLRGLPSAHPGKLNESELDMVLGLFRKQQEWFSGQLDEIRDEHKAQLVEFKAHVGELIAAATVETAAVIEARKGHVVAWFGGIATILTIVVGAIVSFSRASEPPVRETIVVSPEVKRFQEWEAAQRNNQGRPPKPELPTIDEIHAPNK